MILEVADLNVRFNTPEGDLHAVNGLGFSVAKGRTLGIVGESGSGKSQSVLAMMGLLAGNGSAAGSVRFDGKEILNLPPRQMNKLRGMRIAMIFQDPMTSLNPYLRIGTQMMEVLEQHKGMKRADARERSVEMLRSVHISDPGARFASYPHELSGGMRQRVMIAMALLCDPDLLIADEPTTALDVTVQAQILGLLKELQAELHTAVILITHDLGVVAGSCDDVLVIYGGQVMERGPVDEIFYAPRHPYTRGLLSSMPSQGANKHAPLTVIKGSPPDLRCLPAGCPFVARCDQRLNICESERPGQFSVGTGHLSACHLESAS
ncbi:MAG: ABC transporter ATP-binding protein [Gammaproteobacteria bacterium]|nr:ABC transporter ATP-binding protein [Gammaproteobacteria bacterium]